MLGVGIHDGDLLVVDRSLEASHNRVVIAVLEGELLVKKLSEKRDMSCCNRLTTAIPT